MKEKLKDRHNLLAIAMILIFSIILLQLVNLQIINGEKNSQDSQHKLLNNWEIVAPRGNITDRNGIPIATSRQGYNIQITKSKMTLDERNTMLLKLIKIFEKNNNDYNKSFEKLITIKPLSFGTSFDEGNEESKLGKLKKQLKTELFVKAKYIDPLPSLKDIFTYLRDEVYEIDKAYSDEDAYKIMSMRFEIRGYNELNPVLLAKDVGIKTVAEIEERSAEFPGVTVDTEPVRQYTDAKYVSHVLGYMRTISEEQYKAKKDEGYKINDLIGKAGVELAAEGYLRGKNGKRLVEVNTFGKRTGDLEAEAAIPGNDVILTIDMRLQKIAAEALERRINEIRAKIPGDTAAEKNMGDACAGSVVAIDVNTGEILAMVSYPGFDPTWYLAGANDKAAQKAIKDLNNNPQIANLFPQMNRAIEGIYAPGSTYKPLIGIAALESGAIGAKDTIFDKGYVEYEGVKRYCLEGSHGAIDLSRALATSCNIYFHEVGIQTGIDVIEKWAALFGFGKPTGIDVDSGKETKGILASRQSKKDYHKDYPVWGRLDTALASIGQHDNAFSPLQIANYVSAISNGGKLYKPHLFKKIVKYDGSIVNELKPEFEKIPVKQETLDAVTEGMLRVTNSEDGTAFEKFKDLPFKVAGKTGTAETGSGSTRSNNGVFICYAPAGDPNHPPEIAIAAVIERGVYGRNASNVAHDILKEYYNVKYSAVPVSTIEAEDPALIK